MRRGEGRGVVAETPHRAREDRHSGFNAFIARGPGPQQTSRSRDLEDSGYKRLADLFRGFLKRGPGQAASPSEDRPVRRHRGR